MKKAGLKNGVVECVWDKEDSELESVVFEQYDFDEVIEVSSEIKVYVGMEYDGSDFKIVLSEETKKDLESKERQKKIIEALEAENKSDAIIKQINMQREAFVEVYKVLSGEAPDSEKIQQMLKVNQSIDKILSG